MPKNQSSVLHWPPVKMPKMTFKKVAVQNEKGGLPFKGNRLNIRNDVLDSNAIIKKNNWWKRLLENDTLDLVCKGSLGVASTSCDKWLPLLEQHKVRFLDKLLIEESLCLPSFLDAFSSQSSALRIILGMSADSARSFLRKVRSQTILRWNAKVVLYLSLVPQQSATYVLEIGLPGCSLEVV